MRSLGNVVACDTETTGLHVHAGDRPYAVGFCDNDGNREYVRWGVDPYTRKVKVRASDVRAMNKLFSSGRRFVFHNGKFDVQMLAAVGVTVPDGWSDTLVGFRCLRTDQPADLKTLGETYCGIPKDDEKDLRKSAAAGRRKGRKEGYKLATDVEADYWLADPELCKRYCLNDCERTVLVWLMIEDRLQEVQETYDVEMQLQPTIMRMEQRGVRVDFGLMERSRRKLDATVDKLLRQIRAIAGDDTFNPNSPAQKAALLYDRLEFPVLERTRKTNNPKTDRNNLEKINHPVARLMLEHSAKNKLRQFFASWEDLAVERNDAFELHPSFNPQAARTGRFSASGPNLQQVPKRDPVAAALCRAPFIPRNGKAWIVADYSQMELRMMAALAAERAMLDAFAAGRDIHLETAVKVFGKPAHEITDAERSAAKNINFAIIYGAGPAKVAAMIGCEEAWAVELIDRYFAEFPAVKDFMVDTAAFARNNGYIETPYGRRVDVPQYDIYKAVNYRVQGSGADVMKRKLIELDRIDVCDLLLTVHDEAVLELDARALSFPLMRTVKEIMEGGTQDVFGIVLPVDVAIVDESWAIKEDAVFARVAA